MFTSAFRATLPKPAGPLTTRLRHSPTCCERAPFCDGSYWGEGDPARCDGEGAKSFGALLRRAEAALGRLAALPSSGPVYVFSHGQFVHAMRTVVTGSELDDRGKILRFWRKGEPLAIGNAELVSSYIQT